MTFRTSGHAFDRSQVLTTSTFAGCVQSLGGSPVQADNRFWFSHSEISRGRPLSLSLDALPSSSSREGARVGGERERNRNPTIRRKYVWLGLRSALRGLRVQARPCYKCWRAKTGACWEELEERVQTFPLAGSARQRSSRAGKFC